MHSHTPSQKSSPLRNLQVVGSVTEPGSLVLAGSAAVANLCDIVEFRADGLEGVPGALQQAMATCPVPALLTVRAPEEGGLNQLSPSHREKLIRELLPNASLLDMEISHLPAFASLVDAARQRETLVIASFHDFTGTPDREVLEDLIAQATAAGADAVKFATTVRNTKDLAILMHLQESAPVPLATMGMGPLGRVSRLLLASLGSVLNYGYLDHPTIPGQWPARRLRELIQELREG